MSPHTRLPSLLYRPDRHGRSAPWRYEGAHGHGPLPHECHSQHPLHCSPVFMAHLTCRHTACTSASHPTAAMTTTSWITALCPISSPRTAVLPRTMHRTQQRRTWRMGLLAKHVLGRAKRIAEDFHTGRCGNGHGEVVSSSNYSC